MESSYITSAQKASQLPSYDEPEVAFIGRSNSGKSSLLNALLDRKNLARTSRTPGRTQMVNFFKVSRDKITQSMIFADLPGYGFNVAIQSIQNLWGELMETYLQRPNIIGLCVLMDIRRDLEGFEVEFLKKLVLNHPLYVVLTKSDKISKHLVAAKERAMEEQLQKCSIPVMAVRAVSNLNKQGIQTLRDQLFQAAGAKG